MSGMEGARTLCKEIAFIDTETCVSFVDSSEAQVCVFDVIRLFAL